MKRLLICAMSAVFGIMALTTASAPVYSKPAAYEEAARAFQSETTIEQRLIFQVFLTAAGYWNAVPNENFNHRLYEAIQKFQGENGYNPDGVITGAQIKRLSNIAFPMLDLWGFQAVTHPYRRVTIWAPLGLGLRATRNQFGLSYDDPQKRIHLDFTTVPNVSINANFDAVLANALKNGAYIHYKVFKDGWYVISASTPDGVDWYFRYHQDGSNVTGFTLSWNNAHGNISAERIAILMSASLWSDMTGASFVQPPKRSLGAAAGVNPPPVTTPATKETEPLPPPPPPKEEAKITTGTGFFVTPEGDFVTNAHVIEKCEKVLVKTDDGSVVDARRTAMDTANDLALLKISKSPTKPANLRFGIRLGESIAAFGFPHSDILSTSGNFTLGNITATNGIGDDSRYLQISAPVQSGNSGGPLLDQNGNLVGVVSSKLNALKVAVQDGDLPQNVNFAIKAAILATFLDSNRITFQTATGVAKPLEAADLADLAKAISGFVVCR
jgi:serine protease Do